MTGTTPRLPCKRLVKKKKKKKKKKQAEGERKTNNSSPATIKKLEAIRKNFASKLSHQQSGIRELTTMSKEMELRCGLDSGYHTPSSSAQTPELPKKKKPSNSPLIKQALRRVSQQLQQPDMLCELTAIQNRREDSAPESGYDTPSSGMQTPELGIKKNPSPLMINQAITKSLKNRAFYHQSDPCEFANDEGTFEERSENQGNPLYSTSDPVTSEFKEELYADSHVQPAKSLAFPDIPVSDFLYLHEQHYEERRGGMAEEVVLSELFNLPLLLAHSEKGICTECITGFFSPWLGCVGYVM